MRKPHPLLCSLIFSSVFAVTLNNAIFAQEEKDSEKKNELKRTLPLEPARKIAFTTNEGTWMSLDISPDGQTIVFELVGDLYSLPIRGGNATRITSGMAFDTQPRFSPDGKRIVFVSDRSGSENIWLLEVGKIVDDLTPTADSTGLKPLTKGKGGTVGHSTYVSPEWTPDGQYIITTMSSGTSSQHLWMFHVDGGRGVDLTKSYSGQRFFGAAFGKGDRFIYFAHTGSNRGYIYRVSMPWQIAKYDRETGEIFNMTGEVGGGMRPALSSDGKWMVYASRYEEKTGFRLRDMRSGTEKWLAYPVQRDDSESISTRDLVPGYSFTPENNAIIASFNGKFYRIEIPSGIQQEISFNADISLDLGSLAHFQKKVDDGPVKVKKISTPDLSPDGKQLVFTALDKVHLMDIETKKIEKLVDQDMGQFIPVWSPDGEWIAFISWSERKGGDVYKVRSNGRELTKLSTVSAFYDALFWKPDGSEVLVAKGLWQQRSAGSLSNPLPGQGLDLVRIPSDGGEDILVSPLKGISMFEGGGRPHFADDPERVYLYEQGELLSMRLDGTDRKKHLKVTGKILRGFGHPLTASEILMSPNGKHALVLDSQHLYRVAVPKVGGEIPSISIAHIAGSSFPVEKLTTIGGVWTMRWSLDGSEIVWPLGNTVFRYDFDEAKAAEIVAESILEGEKKENDDVPYKPESIIIDIEAPRLSGNGTLVLRGAKIITMDTRVNDEGVIDDGAVVITNNRVSQVGKSLDIRTPEGAQEIAVTGKTIVPGFVDTHSHMFPAFGVHRGVVWEYLANLAYGVITTRDVQTTTTDVLTYSDLVETGNLVGPRVFHTGPGIFSLQFIMNQKDADRELRRYKDFYKVSSIKMYTAGDRDVRQMIVKSALENELLPTTEGAGDFKMNFTNVIDGYNGQEHSFPIAPLYKDFVNLFARSGTVYTPTLLVAYGAPNAEDYFFQNTNVHDDSKLRTFFPHTELDKLTRRRRAWFKKEEHGYSLLASQLKKIVDAGGKVAVGSHGQLQGLGYHWELWALQSGGLSEMEALRCATVFGAEALGYGNDLGSISVGKLADLVVLNKNPLDDIRNSASTHYVMKNGLLYDANTLDMMWPYKQKLAKPYWQNIDKAVIKKNDSGKDN